MNKIYKSQRDTKSIMKKTSGGDIQGNTARTSKVDFKSDSAATLKDDNPAAEVPEPPKKIKLEYPLKEQTVNEKG